MVTACVRDLCLGLTRSWFLCPSPIRSCNKHYLNYSFMYRYTYPQHLKRRTHSPCKTMLALLLALATFVHRMTDLCFIRVFLIILLCWTNIGKESWEESTDRFTVVVLSLLHHETHSQVEACVCLKRTLCWIFYTWWKHLGGSSEQWWLLLQR